MLLIKHRAARVADALLSLAPNFAGSSSPSCSCAMSCSKTPRSQNESTQNGDRSGNGQGLAASAEERTGSIGQAAAKWTRGD